MPERDRWSELCKALSDIHCELLAEGADRQKVLRASQILGVLQEIYLTSRQAKEGAGGATRAKRVPEEQRHYVIERLRGGEFLAEYRAAGQQPFRCPSKLYDVIAEAIATFSEPALFEELLEAIRRRSKHPFPDYLPRMCLRFWTGLNPPLVERSHSRYRAARPASFARDARRAWRELAHPKEQ
jgi:hypothetical protein